MLELLNINYRYSRKSPEVLHDISASIGSGCHLLIGENGSGKTTLLHIMSALRYPTSGSCTLDDTTLIPRRPSLLSRIQFFGDGMEFPAPSIDDMVRAHSPFFPNFDSDMLLRNLDTFGISPTTKFKKMSLGTRHKAQLAYMLSLRCDILLLDEPTNGLDIGSRQAFRRMILECLSEDQTLVVSSHTPGDFEDIYDSIMLLSRGRLLVNLPIEEITSRIAFVNSPTTLASALYCEPQFGTNRCIVPNPDGSIQSQFDLTMLYNSLMSDNRDEILKHL